MSAEKITVLNPVGFPPKVVAKPLAPRLSTLDGKTVYLVDCRFDDSDVFLKQMQAWFGEHMPGVRTVFKPISSVYLKDDPATVGTPYCASIVIACAATAGARDDDRSTVRRSHGRDAYRQVRPRRPLGGRGERDVRAE